MYDFLNAKAHPKSIAKRLDSLSERYGHGCVVLIPAFNNFNNSELWLWEIVFKVAAYNFAPAIYQGKLAISVQEKGKTKRLDATSLESVLEQDQDRVRAANRNSFFGGLRPSGQNAYSILRALTESKSQSVQVGAGSARVNLLMHPMSGYTRIDLFRNGMWITDNVPGLSRADFANCQPFHAVITVDADDGGELHRLIRKAEGPMHDKLSVSLLSKSEEKTLRRATEEISAWIAEQAPSIGSDEYTVDDFLLVDIGDDGPSGKENFSFWGAPTPVSRRSSSQMNLTTDGGGGEGNETEHNGSGSAAAKSQTGSSTAGSKGSNRRRPLPFRSAVIPDGNGKLTGSVVSADNFAEAWLTVRVDENTDFTCDRVWQDEDVCLKSFHIAPADGSAPLEHEIIEDGRFVKIQGIVANTDYVVRVGYGAISALTDIVERPVLRLEMHRPPATATAATDKEGGSDANSGN